MHIVKKDVLSVLQMISGKGNEIKMHLCMKIIANAYLFFHFPIVKTKNKRVIPVPITV